MDIAYEQLPQLVKDNLTPDQWEQAQRAVVPDKSPVPETTVYVNLKNGQCLNFEIGEPANGPLLPVHDLAGGRGKEDAQFHTSPPGSHGVP